MSSLFFSSGLFRAIRSFAGSKLQNFRGSEFRFQLRTFWVGLGSSSERDCRYCSSVDVFNRKLRGQDVGLMLVSCHCFPGVRHKLHRRCSGFLNQWPVGDKYISSSGSPKQKQEPTLWSYWGQVTWFYHSYPPLIMKLPIWHVPILIYYSILG